jgi:hypothetical protein
MVTIASSSESLVTQAYTPEYGPASRFQAGLATGAFRQGISAKGREGTRQTAPTATDEDRALPGRDAVAVAVCSA